MLNTIPEGVSNVVLHTGNMLYYTDVTKQVNMLTTEQIVEGLKTSISLFDKLPAAENDVLHLKRAMLINQTEEERKNLQTMIKVFITSPDLSSLRSALQYTIKDVGISCIDSVILSYINTVNDQKNILDDYMVMWKILEEFVQNGEVINLGISDIETDIFIQLYEAAQVKPSINQINLNACCVVPQDLQDFCKGRDIRILTHNDPLDILPVNELLPLFRVKNGQNESGDEKILSSAQVSWVTRFQAHIRCRGILASKGYIVKLKLGK